MPHSDTLQMAAEFVVAFVANNSVPTGELPILIQAIHAAFTKLHGGMETAVAQKRGRPPAVSVRASIRPAYLICLEDGKRFKSLKKHLATHGLTPEQYRAKWKLPYDYPMVAPNYGARRSAIAKAINLGRIRSKA